MTIADRKQIKRLATDLKRHSDRAADLFQLAHILGTDPASLKRSIESLAHYAEQLEEVKPL